MDEELLARMEEADRDDSADSFRVKMPNTRIGEMFALADQILGGRRLRVVCADGKTRLARIPGKMRRREWVSQGDLIILMPWDFQDEKADVKYRYSKTQALYLSRKQALPEIVDVFGLGREPETDADDEGLWGGMDEADEPETAPEPEPEAEPAVADGEDDGDDDLWGDDDGDDDLWGGDDEADDVSTDDDASDDAESIDDADAAADDEAPAAAADPADGPTTSAPADVDEDDEDDVQNLEGFFN